MSDVLGQLMSDAPRDKWGHPILPIPDDINRKEYERALLALQVELVKMQSWVRATGQRVLIVFEGRDTAGKGGTIQRMREHLNPRFARHVALPAPTDAERGQWYLQRYVEHLPSHGEIALFDRSWYNRAGVERVMGFATEQQIELFFEQVVPFEQFLVSDGIHLSKIWLSVSQEEQARRLDDRRRDPLKQWKLSPLDDEAAARWADYTTALVDMLGRTDSDHAPWWFVNNNTKRVGRLNVIRHVLRALPYDGKDADVVRPPRADIVAPARSVLPELRRHA
jgi:polyphosphate kinase